MSATSEQSIALYGEGDNEAHMTWSQACEILSAIRDLAHNWESGDLAGAVQDLCRLAGEVDPEFCEASEPDDCTCEYWEAD